MSYKNAVLTACIFLLAEYDRDVYVLPCKMLGGKTMICSKCGNVISEGSRFCTKCGTPLAAAVTEATNTQPSAPQAPVQQPAPQQSPVQAPEAQQAPVQTPATQQTPVYQQSFTPVATSAPNKKFPVIPIIAGAAAVVLILLVILIFTLIPSGGGYANKKGEIQSIYFDDKYYVFNAGNYVSTDCESSNVNEFISKDGSTIVYLDNSELYYSKGEKFKKIGSDVSSDFFSSYVFISDNGNTVIFVSGDELMVSKNGEKGVKIANLEDSRLSSVCISPDGNTAVYSVYDKDSYDYSSTKSYLYDGKNVSKDYIKARAAFVSNGGSVIYGVDNNDTNKLVMFRGIDGEKTTVSNDVGELVGISSDYKSIMFTASTSSGYSTYYFDPSLAKKVKVCSGSLSLIIPDNSYAYSNFNSFLASNVNGSVYRYTRRGEDFEDPIKITSASNYLISADGNTILYVKGGKLYRNNTINADSEVKLASHVDSYYLWADSSLKNVYYYDSDAETFYYVAGSEDSKTKILDECPYSAVVTDSGVCVYKYDGTSIGCSVRGSKEKVKGISEVSKIYDNGNAIIALAEDDEGLFISKDGINFSKVK